MRLSKPFARGCAALFALAAVPAAAAPAPSPKLVVAISVDQYSAALFTQWRGRYTEGMARLAQGVVYPNAYQSHAITETCPGHASLLTGKYPNKTGIVGNNIRDEQTGREIYCLFDTDKVLAHSDKASPVGPQRLMATTLGDWMKAAAPFGKVVSVSAKDRGAITMGGHAPDGVFWLAPGYGFTTYMNKGDDPAKALAPIAGVNKAQAAMWTRPARWGVASADCKAFTASYPIQDRTFVSQTPPVGFGSSSKASDISGDIMASPIPDDMTAKAALHLIRYFNLGKGQGTDLLTVSFSATDYVGHRYGSQGPEMCDQMHRIDHNVGLVLAAVDALNVPYVVVLSADHGGSDFTERLAERGYPAYRIAGPAVLARVNAQLQGELGLSAAPLKGSLDELMVEVADADRARVTAAAVRVLAAQPEVAAVFTQEELLATPVGHGLSPEELTLKQRYARGAYRGRNADILVALPPYTQLGVPNPGSNLATHTGPWDYDRRVPILFWWKGAPSQTRAMPVETVDIAPTLAALLGLTPPADVDGRCLPLAEKGPAACPKP